MEYLYFALIGLVSGFIAGQIMKGRGFGLIGNTVVGILGALLGGWLSGVTGLSAGSSLLGSIITSVVGAIVLLFLVGLIKK